MTQKPVMIEIDTPAPSPAEAPAVSDLPQPGEAPLQGRAMQIAARLAARPPSRLARFFWRATGALVAFLASVAAWRFVEGMFTANPILGWVASVLFAAFILAALLVGLRELSAFARLKRLDRVHREVQEAAQSDDLGRARKVVTHLSALYAARPEMDWPRANLAERAPEQIDTDTLLVLAETELMTPLDAAARLEIEAAARTVATVTALVPLALADVFTALSANLRMIRRIAEIYGGRAGSLGSLRLARTVMTHLVATGAVAAGDDLIETVTGGHLFSKLSRRFGEGVVNGALTARVGVAAIEVCRPMPFRVLQKPRVANLTRRALTGLFGKSKSAEAE
ncbi:YcjF family protein [Sedimentimonas flavescens]|uniref:YcjF family protein n=1 Tax=Sedimentimonas flavescens TaxID=2851012 RepID=A0ABT2ZU87_9RHOB|nr:TIGR01620 family protein [Sedimentimonas flavescens]MBW0156909.1 YcjF family protein [Sedimentimonas flavescens]MCV2877319.1 YcjF family protein [Sedimentimonas flavescens]